MGPEGKEPHREDVFDSLQGASSLTLLKKISIAAIAIALVAFFLFWSQSSDDKSSSHESSGSLKDRVSSLEDEVQKLKEFLKITPTVAPQADQAGKAVVATPDTSAQVAPQQENINLKSLFEEELKASTAQAPSAQDETTAPEVKEQSTQKTVAKHAQKAQSGKSTVYVVKKGDTLSKISLKFYGSSHKWQRIVEANKNSLGANNTLKVGMKLNIPVAE